MPSAGLEPATPALGRRRSGPLSYEGMLPAARQREVIIDIRRSGRSSARLERSVRDREAESSNLFAPTIPARRHHPARDLGARVEAELVEDVAHVAVDGALRNEQPRPDLLVAQPFQDKPGDLGLALSEQ